MNYMDALTEKLWGLHLKTEQEQAMRNLYLGKDFLGFICFGHPMLQVSLTEYYCPSLSLLVLTPFYFPSSQIMHIIYKLYL